MSRSCFLLVEHVPLVAPRGLQAQRVKGLTLSMCKNNRGLAVSAMLARPSAGIGVVESLSLGRAHFIAFAACELVLEVVSCFAPSLVITRLQA